MCIISLLKVYNKSLNDEVLIGHKISGISQYIPTEQQVFSTILNRFDQHCKDKCLINKGFQ